MLHLNRPKAVLRRSSPLIALAAVALTVAACGSHQASPDATQANHASNASATPSVSPALAEYATWAHDSGPGLSTLLTAISNDEASINKHAATWSADGDKSTALNNEPLSGDPSKLQAQTDALQANTNALMGDLQALSADATKLETDASAALAVPAAPDAQVAQLLQESLQELQQAATSIVSADPASVTVGLSTMKTADTIMGQAVARQTQLATELNQTASVGAAE